MKSGETLYEILEISSEASAEEIRLAYFEQARQYHPDTNPGERAREWFFQVQEAYETLSDPEKRKKYDESIKGKKKTKESVGISIVYNTTTIPRLNEPQLIYAMLEINSTVKIDQSKIPQGHLCLVIDCSTSMKGSRIEMVKENVIRLMNTLKPSDQISIITFNDKPELILSPTRIDEIRDLPEKLSNIMCSGGTEIYKGLKAGFDLLWGNSTSGRVMQLLLLTDGHTYGDENACYDLAKKLQTRGILLNTIGIGHEWNDAFMDRLANITGGNTVFISKAGDLKDHIQKISDSISIVAANSVSLEYQSEEGVIINSIYRLQPDISQLEIEKSIAMGEIYQNKKSSFLMTFTIPPLDDEKSSVLLVKGKLRYETLNPQTKMKLFINMSLPVNGNKSADNPPAEIINALSVITAYQLQEKAKTDVKDGNIEHAVERLGYLSTQLLRLGKPNLAEKALKEAELIKKNKTYSMDGDKQLKYGTRALLAPINEDSKL